MASLRLTDGEFGLLQLSIEVFQQKIASLGLNLIVERDFEKLVRTLKQNNATVINPTIDPQRHEIGPDNFWLNVTNSDGRTVACIATRLFETENFTDLVISGKLFDDRGLEAFLGGETVEIIETSRRIEGTVNYLASLWVHPIWRRKGLSLILPYLSRSLAMRNYDSTYCCAYILSELAMSRLPIDVYGLVHQELSYKGYYPPVSGYEEMYLSYVDAEESLDRLRKLPDHQIYPIAMARDKTSGLADPLPVPA